MKTKQQTALHLGNEGDLSLEKAQETINYVLSEMSAGDKLHSQMHSSPTESVFVFMANGLCATLHIQAYQPIKEKGGRR